MKDLGRCFAGLAASGVAASVAEACPVCILADPKTAGTYLSTTLFMSVLPLAMIGGLIYWLKRRYSPPRPAAFLGAAEAFARDDGAKRAPSLVMLGSARRP
jgi:hypothetical protein